MVNFIHPLSKVFQAPTLFSLSMVRKAYKFRIHQLFCQIPLFALFFRQHKPSFFTLSPLVAFNLPHKIQDVNSNLQNFPLNRVTGFDTIFPDISKINKMLIFSAFLSIKNCRFSEFGKRQFLIFFSLFFKYPELAQKIIQDNHQNI